MARRVLIRNDFDREIIRTGSTAMSEASNACQKFHPLRSDLVVTGAATAADASSSVAYVLIKVFRTARMAHADWQRNAVAPAAQRCRLAQLRTSGDLSPKARKVRLATVARYQTAFLCTGRLRFHQGVLPSYRWNVVLAKGRKGDRVQRHQVQ